MDGVIHGSSTIHEPMLTPRTCSLNGCAIVSWWHVFEALSISNSLMSIPP